MKMPLSLLVSLILSPSAIISQTNDTNLVWEIDIGSTIYSSPAIGPSGEIVFGAQDGIVYCMQPNGDLKWLSRAPTDWVDASPVIYDNTVYAGSWDNSLYAINLEDGSLKWSFSTGSVILASATVDSKGNIYCGSNDGILYSLSPLGELNWGYVTPNGLPIDSSAALSQDEERIYFGADDGILYAINTNDGSLHWSFSVNADSNSVDTAINSSPAIASDGSIIFGASDYALYLLNPDGSLKWSYMATEEIDSSPIIADSGQIVFGCRDGYLYCVDLEGYQLWESLIGDVFYASPLLTEDGQVIIGAYAGNDQVGYASEIFSVDISTGEENWSYFFEGFNDSSPNIAPDGSLYVGSHNGYIYKLDTGSILASSGNWPRFRKDRLQTGNPSQSFTDADPVEWLPQVSLSSEGWFLVEDFGSGWLQMDKIPYAYHMEHGYIYLIPAQESGIWFYDSQLDWLYFGFDAPGYYYSSNTGNWLYHLEGTSHTDVRWFYDYSGAISESGWFEI